MRGQFFLPILFGVLIGFPAFATEISNDTYSQEPWGSLVQERVLVELAQSDRIPMISSPLRLTPATSSLSFEARCSQCHDLQRALAKSKDFANWLATVRRMANKPGAQIPKRDWEPIARYLARRGEPAKERPQNESTSESAASAPKFDLFATLAPVWRGGVGDDVIENQGFFPEAWVGVEWHPNEVISGRVTSCITCHNEGSPGNRIELAELLVRFDVTRALGAGDHGPEVWVQAGRMIVPFGAFSERTNPGAARAISKPLIYNMGQNVRRSQIGPPLLPMPYSDEGVLVDSKVPLCWDVTVTMNAYLVNGLQGSITGVDFLRSRDYVDNNSDPAAGGRVTVGNRFVRLGASVMAGQLNRIPDGGDGPFDKILYYDVLGVDLSARHGDWARFNAEFAVRNSDRFFFDPEVRREDDEVYGFYLEGDVRIWRNPRLKLMMRYDRADYNGDSVPPGSFLTNPRFHVHRFTWGLHFVLPGGSTLRVEHEHWSLPEDLDGEDVFGIQWITLF